MRAWKTPPMDLMAGSRRRKKLVNSRRWQQKRTKKKRNGNFLWNSFKPHTIRVSGVLKGKARKEGTEKNIRKSNGPEVFQI